MNELLKSAIDDAGYQLDKVLEGMSDELFETKLVPSSMSPKEIVAHLYECYVAFLSKAEGKDHLWGEYKVPDEVAASPCTPAFAKRAEAVKVALETDDLALQKVAMDYIALHDAYHIGQMASLRLEREEGWNPYSLYPY